MGKETPAKPTEHGKLYQDQLYGTKFLSPLAVAVIDTPEFQRLSGLKQLGFTDFVYRGAQHTRFCHSVGTYFLTRTIMCRIAQNHERLRLPHPGQDLPDCFSIVPDNAYPPNAGTIPVSHQSKWRGLGEVVSIAALLHDIGHVPFGHTLEDEFSGIYKRHDRLGGPRLYELLFNEQSDLKRVFGDEYPPWIKGPGHKRGIKNEELLQLIYVILSWKEDISVPAGFKAVLKKEHPEHVGNEDGLERLADLENWYDKFVARKMFRPFMTDIIGNTICADLLDYLPRDRMNLGMEFRTHERLQRYLTIRPGQLYKGEGDRVCIMVTRHKRGGQRRDVATAVLDIMRERYEMAERVYYHHKKAAASAMLAKLAEICPSGKPPDDVPIYPAPWTLDVRNESPPTHMAHFSDLTFIDHLGKADVDSQVKGKEERTKLKALQRQLYVGIRFKRSALYRTLLVVDTDLVQMSARPISYFAKDLRENDNGEPSSEGRIALENELAEAAGVTNGEVLVYCPSSDMQAKEVDARLEIIQDRVLPLRVQRESFAYHADVKVLEQYYQQLWLVYVFVSPALYASPRGCQAVVDQFCEHYAIERMIAYNKVRGYSFKIDYDVVAARALEPLRKFFKGNDEEGLPFGDTPSSVVASVMAKAAKDAMYLKEVKSNSGDMSAGITRIGAMFDIVVLEAAASILLPDAAEQVPIRLRIKELESGRTDMQQLVNAARRKPDLLPTSSFSDYREQLLASITRAATQ